MAMRLFRDLPQVFSPSSTPSGFLYFSVQRTFGLWLLMSLCYSLAQMALLPLCKAFCYCLLEKTEALILLSHSSERYFTRWKRQGAWRTAAF